MKEFEYIKQALEEHLNSINENTAEVQMLFDCLHEVEMKVDKLSQRLDQLQLAVKPKGEDTGKIIAPLNHLEKDIFLVFYTEEMPLSSVEISQKVRIPVSTVTECVSSLLSKGIPLLRSRVNDHMFFKLSPSFKEKQAKENVVNLSLQNFIE